MFRALVGLKKNSLIIENLWKTLKKFQKKFRLFLDSFVNKLEKKTIIYFVEYKLWIQEQIMLNFITIKGLLIYSTFTKIHDYIWVVFSKYLKKKYYSYFIYSYLF